VVSRRRSRYMHREDETSLPSKIARFV